MKVKYDLIVVGAGGTGTYFLKEISRMISTDVSVSKQIREMYIVDGDTVEEKNLNRQAFLPEDIGRNKAAVMADVLNSSFDLGWRSIATYMTKEDEMKKLMPSLANPNQGNYLLIPVVIGCVDNHGFRMLMEKLFDEANSLIYFDSANEFSAGECVLSYKMNKKVLGPCRSHYFPDIKNGDLRNITEISCEELNQVAPQHIFTNMMAGLQLCSAFSNLCKGKPTPGFTFFNPHTFYNEFIPYKEDAKS